MDVFLERPLFSEVLVVSNDNFLLSLSDKDNSPNPFPESFNENFLTLNFLINEPTGDNKVFCFGVLIQIDPDFLVFSFYLFAIVLRSSSLISLYFPFIVSTF